MIVRDLLIYLYIQFYRRLVFRPQLVTDYTSFKSFVKLGVCLSNALKRIPVAQLGLHFAI